MPDSSKKPQTQEISELNKFFKVFFTGSSNTQMEGLTLTFYGLENDTLNLPQFPGFLSKYKELAKKKQFYAIDNIKEVIALGKADKSKILQFVVLLYSIKDSNDKFQRAGLLIGNHKEKGYTIIGLWPFNSVKSASISIENFKTLLQMILTQHEKFEDLLLIM
jgi:hypothetical protein